MSVLCQNVKPWRGMIVIQIIVNTHDHRRRATAMASPGLRQNVHMPTTSLRITTSPYLNKDVSVCTALQRTETCTWYETRLFLKARFVVLGIQYQGAEPAAQSRCIVVTRWEAIPMQGQ